MFVSGTIIERENEEEGRDKRQEKDAKDERILYDYLLLLLLLFTLLYQWNDEDDMCLLLRAEQSRAEQSIARYNIAGV